MDREPDSSGEITPADLASALPASVQFGRLLIRLIPKKRDPIDVLKAQEARGKELRQKLRWPDTPNEVPEVIIIRKGRHANYPDGKTRRLNVGVSDWFKGEVKQVADSTLDIYSQITYVKVDREKWVAREVPDADEDDEEVEKVYVVGKIPLERIEHIRWDGDSAYGLPRIYLSYGRDGPYSKVGLYAVPENPGDYAFELANIKFKPVKRSLWRRFRDNYELRKMEDERGFG